MQGKRILAVILLFASVLMPIQVSAEDTFNCLDVSLWNSLSVEEDPDSFNSIKDSYYRTLTLQQLNTKGRIQKLSQTDKLVQAIPEPEETEPETTTAPETTEATRIVVGDGIDSSYTYETEPAPSGNLVSLGSFRITHYCPCSQCCGPYASGITATGTYAQAGRTIAVNPNQIPYGSQVVINGHTYTAEDCGGAIGSNCIDIFVSSHSEALQKGVYYAEVFLVQ